MRGGPQRAGPAYSHAKSISNLVAADPLCHKLLNVLDSLRGKFDASAPSGRAGIRHRHGCTVGSRAGDLGGLRVLRLAFYYLCSSFYRVTGAIQAPSTKNRDLHFLDNSPALLFNVVSVI
jgi:hypothetical protein